MTRIDLPQDTDAIQAVLIDRVNQHSRLLDEQRKAIEELRDENRRQNETLEQIAKNLASIVEMFSAGESLVNTLRWAGKVVVWVSGIVTAVYGIYFAITSWPHKGG